MDISSLENLARQGRWSQIEKIIAKTSSKDLRRSNLIALAGLARRAYRMNLACKLLRGHALTPGAEIDFLADPKALIEYATCLSMLGARKSALQILKRISVESPELEFAWVTLHFSEYAYDKALPHIERYLQLAKEAYPRLIGRLNHCAAKVVLGEHEGLYKDLDALKKEFTGNSYSVLLANTFELEAQLLIRQGAHAKAIKHLQNGFEILPDKNHVYAFFIEKWLTIAKSYLGEVTLEQLQYVLKKADLFKNYHAKRDLVFHWGRAYGDDTAVKKVFFGSPLAGYRNYLQRCAPEMDFNKTRMLFWNGHFLNHEYTDKISVSRLRLENLRLSANEMQLFSSLLNDFFEPKSVGTIFEAVYPDEIYQPFYSAGKTYKLIERLKNKLHRENIPLSLESCAGKYQLHLHQGIMIEVPNPAQFTGTRLSDKHLESKLGKDPFTRAEVMQLFDLNKAASIRWLNQLASLGKVRKIGSGPGSFYRLIA